MRITNQTNKQKAEHFASIGLMNHAAFYANMAVLDEIVELKELLCTKSS